MRRTRHRRRYHTDRIVSNRRARYLREVPPGSRYINNHPSRWGYGAMSDRDPWDCGRSCYMCHFDKLEPGRRERANRAWRKDWEL